MRRSLGWRLIARHAGLLASVALSGAWAGCGRGEPPGRVSDGPSGSYEASLMPVAGALAVAWYDTRDGHGEIYQRRLNADGRPAGPERRLTTTSGDAFEADLQEAAGDVVIAWYDKSKSGTLQPAMGRWSLDGTRRWQLALAPLGRNTVARVHGDRIFAAWIVDEGGSAASIWGGWWTLDGQPLDEPLRIAAAGRTTWNLNAAIDAAGRAWLVFDARVGTRMEELFLATVDGRLSTVARLTTDDGFASKYPDLALSDDGRAALTWFDDRDGNQEVYLAVLPAAELAGSVKPAGQRVTRTPGASFGAYVAWNRDRVGLAWSDASPGQAEIYFAAFDARGQQIGQTQQVTSTSAESQIPCIRPWRDGFALAWNETQPPPDTTHAEDGGRAAIHVALVR